MKVDFELVKQIYKSTPNYEQFVKEIELQIKIKKQLKENKSKLKNLEIYIEESEDDITTIQEYVKELPYWDMYYDYDGLPDGGIFDEMYIKIKDIVYLVKLHCEVEWNGEWSVRKNLPDELKIIDITEIDCEIVDENTIRLK